MNSKGCTLCSFLLAFVSLTFCSTTPSEEAPNVILQAGAVEKPADLVTVTEPPTSQPRTNVASDLDHLNRFVLGNRSKILTNPLYLKCRKDSGSSPFCYTVLSREFLEQKHKQRPKRSKSVRFGFGNFRPRFSKGTLGNWERLKQSNVNYMIKTFSKLKSEQIQIIKANALSDQSCPNNPAIAIAATLEDFLPIGADPLELAALYEKGAECISQSPADQEIFFTRAGLFFFLKKKYELAAKMFEKAKSIDVPYTGRPLYWLSRCYTEMGERKSAEMTIELLRTRYPFSFHTIVALTAEKLDPGEVLSGKSVSGSLRRSQQNPNVNLLIDQVELLRQHGYSAAASRVWDWAAAESQGYEPEVRLYVAELKQDSADHLSRISLLSDILYRHPQLVSRQSMDLYFPKAFYPVFESNVVGLDPNLLLALARQESAFNPKARSVANARGLMQLLPKTGRLFKKRLDLYDPVANVEVGSRYLYELLKRLNGNIPLALASYNAGPERVSTWTGRYPADNPVLFTDLIPFRETRDYVASVLRNYYWYRRMNSANDEKFIDLVFEAQLAERAVSVQ